MKKEQFIKKISESTGIDEHDIEAVLSNLTETLPQLCSGSDTVAIPGFGTFSCQKKDETVEKDDDGNRWLFPPSLAFKFRPSILLRNKLKK